MGKIVQIAGRKDLGEFAPEFAAFNLAKGVWQPKEGDLPYEDEAMRVHAKSMVFPIGQPNDAFAEYFVGQSYLAPVSTDQVGIFNVTFEPGCRNNWHGAAPDEWFSHLAIEVPGVDCSNEWCEAVSEEEYASAQ